MVQILMYIIAVCAVLGGIDRMTGNHLGLGKAFEQAFQMLGPLALSMAGMICLAPAAASALSGVISPLYRLLGQDPGMFGSVLAIDMGGYQMSMAMADEQSVGRFAGILVGATLGCTISFTIPTGMGILPNDTREDFAWGLMLGLVTMPAALFAGALMCGIPCLRALVLCIPLALLAAVLAVCMRRFPAGTAKAFRVLAEALKIIATLGLTIGAFQSISGVTLISTLTPLEDAMKIVASICVMLLGSLPLAELLKRLLRKPFSSLGEKLGVGSDGLMTMLVIYLNITPSFAMLPDLNPKARRMNAAFGVCAASALTAHMAFTMECEPDLVAALLVVKLLGGLLGAGLAVLWKKDYHPMAKNTAG